MKIFTGSRLITVGLMLAVLAVIYRNDDAKDVLTGNDKFLGLF